MVSVVVERGMRGSRKCVWMCARMHVSEEVRVGRGGGGGGISEMEKPKRQKGSCHVP